MFRLQVPGLACVLGYVLLAVPARGAYAPPVKYIIVSNARNGTISYVRLPGKEVKTLVTDLGHPQGIAVDQKRQLLLVADSQLKKVVSYGLFQNRDGSLSVDEQTPVLENIETRWVAVDGLGNIYATDETANRIIHLAASKVMDGDTSGTSIYEGNASASGPALISTGRADRSLLEWEEPGVADVSEGLGIVEVLDETPRDEKSSPMGMLEVLDETPRGEKSPGIVEFLDETPRGEKSPPLPAISFMSSDVQVQAALSAPGGVAVDNFYVYWTNKVDGRSTGTVVRDLQHRSNTSASSTGPQQPQVIATNLPKAYGVCTALDNVFYTSSEMNLYVVKRSGGDPVLVASNFTSPRGCAWDGDSTIYVADRAEGGVFAVPGPMVSLAEAPATKVFDIEDAFGVAVFSGAFGIGITTTLLVFVTSLFAFAALY